MKIAKIGMVKLLIVFFASEVFGQSQIVENLSFHSKILSKSVQYNIYLPDGYYQNHAKYSVLYLFHGYSFDHTSWTKLGDLKQIADRSFKESVPHIIVMPDAGVTWYQNSIDGKVNYEDFFIKEFINHIDSAYGTLTLRENRALAGFSMGGLGAFLYATKYPELFSSAGMLAAASYTDQQTAFGSLSQARYDEIFGDLYGKGLVGNERLNDLYKQSAPIHIIETGNVENLKKVRYYIDCGEDDYLIKGNMKLHEAMIEKKIPHEFRVRDGEHDWKYWKESLPEVLKFISNKT